MEYPKILSLEEQEQRYLFSRFINMVFSFGTETTTQFAGSLSPSALLDIYKKYNPKTTLLEDMVTHTLLFGGFVNKQGNVYLKIKEDMFLTLPPVTQERIISYCDFAKSLRLRQKMLGDNPEAVHRDIVLDESFRHFIQTQIFNNRFKYWYVLNKTGRRTSLNDLYEYYQVWCLKRGYVPNTKKNLSNTLEHLGYKVKIGYCDNKSGVKYIDSCVIPRTEVERQYTEKYNDLGILIIGNKHIFNDNMILEDLNEEGLQAYLNARRYKSSEQSYAEKKRSKKEETNSQQKSTNRNRTTISAETISEREEEIFKGEKRRTDRRNNEQDESVTQISSRTSVRITESKLSEDKSGFAANKVTSGKSELAQAVRAASSADRNSFHDSLGLRADVQIISPSPNKSDRTSEEIKPEYNLPGAEKRAFFTGLRVTYRLSPSTFDYDFFKEEITKANIRGLSEENKRVLYEEFLKTIKK